MLVLRGGGGGCCQSGLLSVLKLLSTVDRARVDETLDPLCQSPTNAPRNHPKPRATGAAQVTPAQSLYLFLSLADQIWRIRVGRVYETLELPCGSPSRSFAILAAQEPA